MNERWVIDGPRKDRRIIWGKPELFYIIISIKCFPFISCEKKKEHVILKKTEGLEDEQLTTVG